MSELSLTVDGAPRVSPDELRLAWRVAARARLVDEHMVRLASRGDVRFAIWGPGEEVHGTATALALHRVARLGRFGIVPHYRSGALLAMWAELHGHDDFERKVYRQLFSRDTDEMSRGRQMVYHLHIPELGILPVQSPVGMQLGKAAGYAMGFRHKGIEDGFAMAVLGDGTTAESDLHEAMNAASVWSLPLLIMVTDNGVAISTTPEEGRGIRDFAAYAEAFGAVHFTCDGRDFHDSYRTAFAAARTVRDEQRPVLLHVRNLPRFNGHSSAADMTFDLSQPDPLVAFGKDLVARGILEPGDELERVEGHGRDFFAHHRLGRVMEEEDRRVRAVIDAVRAEPEPDPATLDLHVHPPFPEVQEAPAAGRTVITYGGAIRAALDHILRDRGGVILGQDVGRLGGVMQATAGLQARHPGKVIDAPLNEPLIVGVSAGLSLHEGLVGLPEVQFGDYSLNAFHWLVHMGNLHWTTAGRASFSTILRMPVDPFGGGAVYHSMSVDGYFTAIPGLVVIMPSTSFDVYGLLLTAADYGGPVVCLEPKWMYRQSLGPAFPGEPTEREAVAALRKLVMRGGVPELDPDLRVPIGKAAVRRAGGDLTVVAWGRAVWTSLAAAERLAAQGVEAEVIDLRTLVPPDLDAVIASARRTGALVVAAEDRAFAGFARVIQGHVAQALPGVPTRAVGQRNLPGIAQSPVLEDAQVLDVDDVIAAARAVIGAGSAPSWGWLPPRYFID